MRYRYAAILLAGMLTSVRVFSPTLLENSTDFIFHTAQVFNISFLDIQSASQTMSIFYGLVVAELLCALYMLFNERRNRSRYVAATFWVGILIFQVASNAYSWIGALESNCGVGLFRDDPRWIALVHVGVAVGLALGAGGWTRD